MIRITAYKCGYCGKIFETKVLAERHTIICDKDKRSVNCINCINCIEKTKLSNVVYPECKLGKKACSGTKYYKSRVAIKCPNFINKYTGEKCYVEH